MKICVESYSNGNKLSDISKDSLPKIKNPTVLSIIDEAVFRNNKYNSENYPGEFYNSGNYNGGNNGDARLVYNNSDYTGNKL